MFWYEHLPHNYRKNPAKKKDLGSHPSGILTSMNNLIIRKSDIPDRQYSALIAQITKTDRHLSCRTRREIAGSITQGYFLLAFLKGGLVGWLEQAPIWNGWVGLFSFYVKPGYRNKGIGTSLLQEALKNGAQVIYAATSNKWVSKKLTSLGFKKTRLNSLPLSFLMHLFWKRFLSSTIIFNSKQLQNKYRYFIR